MKAHRLISPVWGAALLAVVAALPAAAAGNPGPADNGGQASPTGNYLAGRYAQTHDDWGAAARFLGDALTADPTEPSLIRQTFLLQLGEGKVDAALSLASKVREMNGPAPLADALLASAELIRGDIRKGEAIARSIADDGFGKLIGPLLRAWLAAAAGDSDRALKELAPLGESSGVKVLFDLHAGAILDLTGRKQAAGDHYTAALGPQPALRSVTIVGSYLERTGHGGDAHRLYKEFQARNPDNSLINATLEAFEKGGISAPVIGDARQGLAEAFYDLAGAVQHDGGLDMAILMTRIALYLHPGLVPGHVLIGEILQDRERFQEAIAEYRSVESDPTFGWTARLHIADALAELKRDEEAIGLLRTLIDERPEQTSAAYRLGDLYRSAKRWTDAVAAYDIAISRIRTPEDRHWPIYYTRAIALDNAKDWPKAEADLQLALRLHPDEPHLLNYLGYSWIDRGLYLDKAKSMVERAVELRPDDGYIVDSLGWALYKLGDYKGAAEKLERAIELKAMDPTINDHLGDAYWRNGRRVEAEYQWQRALKNSEDASDKARIQAKIDSGLSDDKNAGTTDPKAVR